MLLPLSRVRAEMGAEVGGKAGNLGELLASGFRVPPGFVIPTDAYAETCDPLIADLLDGLPGTAAEIRDRIRGAELPAPLREAITAARAELGAEHPVAVRSSATAEDLPFASFAGQQDTYLNVVGAEPLLDAVRRCWASLWTDRAVAYRGANGVDHRVVRLAVVVQRMVDARAAGVLFTANPVTGCRDEAVIDANRGLGESVVSGAITPDRFAVSGGEITRELGAKTASVRARPGGGTEIVERLDRRASITDAQVRELAEIGGAAAAHFGAPQDLEWAIDGDGEIWLTQARPITTLFPLPPDPGRGLRLYLSVNSAQGVHRPLTPMGIAVLGLLFTGLLQHLGLRTEGSRPALLRDADGWLFADITGTTRNPIGRAVLPRALSVAEARSARIYESVLARTEFAPRGGVPRKLLRDLARVVRRTRAPQRFAAALRAPEIAREQSFDLVDQVRADLDAMRPVTARERLAATRDGFLEVLAPRLAQLPGRVLPVLALSKLLPAIAGTAATDAELQVVLRGVPHNITTEMDLQLWGIARRMDPGTAALFADLEPAELAARYRDRDLPADVLSGLDLFLAQHGHRAFAEIDAGMPRWSDDPTHLLGLLAGCARSAAAGHDAAEQYRSGAEEAERELDEIARRIRNPLRARLARFAMRRVRRLAGLRELPKYCAVLAIAHARAQLLAIGDELAREMRISDPQDVFFLDFEELSALLDGADQSGTIAARRAVRERELRRSHLPPMLLSDGTEPETSLGATGSADELVGISASAGTVTGTARVVRDPTGARIGPGEILVAPSTDPGWTPLFLTAGGLVVETGGPNSHGATVARECGIPAVVGVAGATRRIRDGRTITVRATAGIVEL
ncbi:PEP/pyruvate-binding domain-containing protein [Saccharopolyspora griseoalba]|uniref:PEP/pyruvate-binding domain-containing protein n=1 Tax=Saccharopolyspora griseoalba TaxID=1431848 RepID=A0ABW2LHU8_9PSEU